MAAATCDLLLVPRKAVLKWLDDCLAVEARHAENLDLQAAAARRLAALPPRGAAEDDAATLWAVVVPRTTPGDAPAALIGRLCASRAVIRGLNKPAIGSLVCCAYWLLGAARLARSDSRPRFSQAERT